MLLTEGSLPEIQMQTLHGEAKPIGTSGRWDAADWDVTRGRSVRSVALGASSQDDHGDQVPKRSSSQRMAVCRLSETQGGGGDGASRHLVDRPHQVGQMDRLEQVGAEPRGL